MTKLPMQAVTKQTGFTLLEAIIYIALFSIIFTGIFVSVYPIFTGAERLTANVAAESETAFILSKINYAINNTVTSSTGVVTTPSPGTSANELILSQSGTETYHFMMDASGTFCSAPLLCQQLLLEKNGGTALPLNGSRVQVTNFSVTHTAPNDGAPRFLDIRFEANETPITARYYLRF